MKKTILRAIIILPFLLNNYIFAQSKIKIVVPEVKEGKILDSLFDKILPTRSPNIKYYYFHTNTVKNVNHYSIQELNDRNDIVIMDFNIPMFVENLCYFKFKNFIIFAFGEIPPSEFFKLNGKEKIFTFNWTKELPIRIRPTRPNYDYVNGMLISSDLPR